MAVLGRVLTERREHDTVLESSAADSEWLEEGRDFCAIGLRVEGCSTRRRLFRGEIGNL